MLDNLLEKLNINYEDLTDDEKRTYKEWDGALQRPEVTTDDLRRFLPTYIDGLEHDQNDYKNSKEKDLYLKAAIRNAKMVLAFITGPEKRREWVRRTLEQRMKQ
jgi:hypothetical protein